MAKTYKGLYAQVHSFETLYASWRAARLGKRNRVAVASFEYDLEENLLTLERELREQTYQPGYYTNFYIYDPKQRLVSAAPFRDRVVSAGTSRPVLYTGQISNRPVLCDESYLGQGIFFIGRRPTRKSTDNTERLHYNRLRRERIFRFC